MNNNINDRELLKKALIEMRKMRESVESLQTQLDRIKYEPIAVIGMDCRFPGGGNNPDLYWEMLSNGIDGIREVPPSRWDIDKYYDSNPDIPGKMYTRYGGFIEDVDKFDPQFFGISPREAKAIDPQQRLLLEVSYNALENAGQSTTKIKGSKTGVFIGQCFDDYSRRSINSGDFTRIDVFNSLGNTKSITAGRIAYILGLQGTTLQLDTTCSSSLVAVHLACQSLRNGENSLAIAGGVNLMLSPEVTIGFCSLKALSPDGYCKTFDADANGYVRGEGCGIVVLKRLSDAISDKDNILAVIKGSAVNHDGQSNGLTAPNGMAQEAVIKEALVNARIKPEDVGYIEAHGTGTSLGDPIEVLALGKVFKSKRENKLKIGSVKTNFGHLESAAGVAGLIKVILAIKNKAIPPQLHYKTPNPYIPWDKLSIEVCDCLSLWDNSNRIAGVSSFGMSGTNAHIILGNIDTEAENFPIINNIADSSSLQENKIQNKERPLSLLTLSAKSETSLIELVNKYREYLSDSSSLKDICYSASLGRSHFNYRLAIKAGSIEELKQKLNNDLIRDSIKEISLTNNKIAFLFTGQGSQYVGMGKELYETEFVFRKECDRCFEILEKYLDISLKEIIFYSSELNKTEYTQPAIFTIEYALAQLWIYWGIKPHGVMGHSIGEYVAATIAGVFSLEDALKMVTARGRLMDRLPETGLMVSILGDIDRVKKIIRPYKNKVSIAAINGDKSIVISGIESAIIKIIAELEKENIKYKQLNVSHGFHSPLMEPMLKEFRLVAEEINYNSPQLNIVSNLTGKFITLQIATAEYWCQQIINPVLFADSIQVLNDAGYKVFLECGSKPILLGMGRLCLDKENEEDHLWVLSLKEEESNYKTILSSVAKLYSYGMDIDWDDFYSQGNYQKVILPNYPFEKKSYWLYSTPISRVQLNKSDSLLGRKLNIARTDNIIFENIINDNQPIVVKDHQVFDRSIMPASGYLEIALSLGKEILKDDILTLNDIRIQQPLALNESEITIQSIVNKKNNWEIVSLSNNNWITHATGTIEKEGELVNEDNNLLKEFQEKCAQELNVISYYQELAQQGLKYGNTFQGIIKLWCDKNKALAKIRLPSELLPVRENYRLHPVLLDCCFQAIGATFSDTVNQIYLPVSLEQLSFYGHVKDYKTDYWGCIDLVIENDIYLVNVYLLDDRGLVIAKIDKLRLQKVDPGLFLNSDRDNFDDWLYKIEWQQEELIVNKLNFSIDLELLKDKKESLIANDYLKNKQLTPELENLSIAYIFQAFDNIGLQLRLGDTFTTEELIARYNIVPEQQKLFTRLLEILKQEDILNVSNDLWNVLHPVGKVNLEPILNKIQSYPEIKRELDLLTKCGSQLDLILQGITDPLDILFPQGDLSLLTNLYQESPQAIYFNNSVKNKILEILENKPKSQKFKILEIGAGTGSTTTYLLPELQDKNIEYTFSDISPLFLNKAKEKFSNYDFINYQILDIEREHKSQKYDLIIAVNVIHATEDLETSIKNIQQLLIPQGWFIVAEGTKPLYWVDLTFGFTEGWWRFKDERLSNNHPLIEAKQWEHLLQKNGFDRTITINEQPDDRAIIIGKIPKLKSLTKNPQEDNSTWLIFSNFFDINENFKEDKYSNPLEIDRIFKEEEHSYNLISFGQEYEQIRDRQFKINPESDRDIEKLFRELPEREHKIIYFCNSDNLENNNIDRLSKKLLNPILKLVRVLINNNIKIDRLVLVTQGAISTKIENKITEPLQSTVWGIEKSIALEHPELNCTRIDLDPDIEIEKQLEILITEIENNTTESEIALRGNYRYLPRLQKERLPKLLTSKESQHYLSIDNSGSLDNLYLKPKTREVANDNKVEIEIKATGLNFRDIFISLNLDPGNIKTLGCECTGKIVTVGNDIRDLKIGDRVIAIAYNTFSQNITIDRSLVIKIPDYLSFTDAATIPITFLTAYYAFFYLGKITSGKKVLIHSGTGGVGQAAIQLAKEAGAEIFATASIGKWDYLKSLGVKHIMNSRNLDFVEEIKKITNGEGVDIILNSLSGEFIPANLSVIKKDGYFLEIGKLDIWDKSQVNKQLPNVQYHIIDMVELCQEQPKLIQSMLSELMVKFERHKLKPLPKKVFPLSQSVEAFRYLQQAKHIGKVVITPQLTLDEKSSYLITGGLGGLGILTASWLVEKGARNLLLLGRNKPSEYARQEIQKLEQQGVTVNVIQNNITDFNSLKETLTPHLKSLRGIIHAAGVLDDAAIRNMTWEQMAAVLAPKVTGAWNLHNLTQSTNLDFFVLFSSAVSLLGSPGQANHISANTFLDSLAHYRRSMGLTAMSINWGTWSDIGYAAEKQADARMNQLGINAISPEKGIAILEQLFIAQFSQIGVVNIDWDKFLQQSHFSSFFNKFKKSIIQEKIVQRDLKQELYKANPTERKSLLLNFLHSQLATVLGFQATELDTKKGFFDLGMDSLTAIEFKNRLQNNIGFNLPSTVAFDYPNLESLADYILEKIFLPEKAKETDIAELVAMEKET